MSAAERQGAIDSLTVARTMIEMIERHELLICQHKIDVCRESGWAVLEGMYSQWLQRLLHERDQLQIFIDRQLDALAAR